MAVAVNVNEGVKVDNVTPRGLAYPKLIDLPLTISLYEELAKTNPIIKDIPQGQRVAVTSEFGAGILRADIASADKVVTFHTKKLEYGVFEFRVEVRPAQAKPKSKAKPKAKANAKPKPKDESPALVE